MIPSPRGLIANAPGRTGVIEAPVQFNSHKYFKGKTCTVDGKTLCVEGFCNRCGIGVIVERPGEVG